MNQAALAAAADVNANGTTSNNPADGSVLVSFAGANGVGAGVNSSSNNNNSGNSVSNGNSGSSTSSSTQQQQRLEQLLRQEEEDMDIPYAQDEAVAAAAGGTLEDTHYRQRQQTQQNLGHGENEETNAEEIRNFIQILRASLGSSQANFIDPIRARHILEACAGNMDLAVSIYWEDIVAAQQAPPANGNYNNNAQLPHHREDLPPPPLPAAAQAGQLQLQQQQQQQQQHPQHPQQQRPQLDAPLNNDNQDNVHAQPPPGAPHAVGAAAAAEWANVSDDEAASGHTTKRGIRSTSAYVNKGGSHKWDTLFQKKRSRNQDNIEGEICYTEEEDEDNDDDEEEQPEEADNYDDPLSTSKEPLSLLWGPIIQNRNTSTEGTSSTTTTAAAAAASTRIPDHWKMTGLTLAASKHGPIVMPPPTPSSTTADRVSSHHPRNSTGTPIINTQYCTGITAVISILTALLQSKVTLQGSKLTQHSDVRRRYADIPSVNKTKKLYEQYLVEAITCLLWIAAESVYSHKKRNQRKHAKKKNTHHPTPIISSTTNLHKGKMSLAQSRQLCRVCTWRGNTEEDASTSGWQPNSTSRVDPSSTPIGEAIHTTWTNQNDLRAYVISCMPLFTGPGGCALLLETILRIHGVQRVERMLSMKRNSSNKGMPLLRCSCEEHNGCLTSSSSSLSTKTTAAAKAVNCMSVELLSLLLTGTIHTDFTSWSAQQLGIGLLSCSSPNEIGWALKNPLQPIWILRCDTSYSCIFLQNEKDTSYMNHHGVNLPMVHWSCVSPGVESKFCVVTARRLVQALSPETEDKDEEKNCLSSLQCHPEDRINYPTNYKRWRFTFSAKTDWKPYFRLSSNEKDKVDHRYAPRINLAVWSRFPKADILLPPTTTTSLSIFMQQG